jgi:glutaredoxin
MTPSRAVTVYGADWCEDTRRARRLLRRLAIPHTYLNVDDDLEALEAATALVDGTRRTPVVDVCGQALVEPANDALTTALVGAGLLTAQDAAARLHAQNVGGVGRAARGGRGAAL